MNQVRYSHCACCRDKCKAFHYSPCLRHQREEFERYRRRKEASYNYQKKAKSEIDQKLKAVKEAAKQAGHDGHKFRKNYIKPLAELLMQNGN